LACCLDSLPLKSSSIFHREEGKTAKGFPSRFQSFFALFVSSRFNFVASNQDLLSTGRLPLFGFAFMIAKVTEYLQTSTDYTPFALAFVSMQKSTAEEFLNRGYLLSYLRKYRFNLLIAIILQSLIFTSFHILLYSYNWVLLSIIFLFGITGGYLTWKSENLIPASIMHIVVNLFSVAWRLS